MYRRMFDLSGRVALVTGAAGILGRQFAEAAADHGAKVALADIEGGAAKAAAESVAEIYGVATIGVQVDVSSPESVDAMVANVEEQLGPIDVLNNNAASKGRSLEEFIEPVESFSAESWDAVMDVNLKGMFLVAQAVGNRMIPRGRGSIVQVASIYGIMAPDRRVYEGSDYCGKPIGTPPVYAASKAGVVGLTRYLAAYWAEHGVRVNTLTPGGVESGQNDTFKERYAARVPMGRMARAEELTGAFVFLASDAASYVTGQNIIVDGGLAAW